MDTPNNYINKKAIKGLVKEKGYRISKEGWDALNSLIPELLDRAIFYTRPAKTISSTDILRILARK